MNQPLKRAHKSSLHSMLCSCSSRRALATGGGEHRDEDRDGMRVAPGCSHFIAVTWLPESHPSCYLSSLHCFCRMREGDTGMVINLGHTARGGGAKLWFEYRPMGWHPALSDSLSPSWKLEPASACFDLLLSLL